MYISISYIFCIVVNYLSTWLESDVVAAFYGNYLLWKKMDCFDKCTSEALG